MQKKARFLNINSMSQKEINSMVAELQQLRRHSNVRQDQTMRREKKLNDQIGKMKKQLSNRYFLFI